jgi:small basic protein
LDKLGFDYYKLVLMDLGFHIFKNQFEVQRILISLLV